MRLREDRPRSVQQRISIHAPAKGATRLRRRAKSLPGYFNPRTREGCDRPSTRPPRSLPHFNPRTREGCDCVHRIGCQDILISIHAPAKGATDAGAWVGWFKQFQSTHPRRVRLRSPAPGGCRGRISIHAPAKGATGDGRVRGIGDGFQSTHPRRVRRSCRQGRQWSRADFNPRTREGCDRDRVQSGLEYRISIHAPAKGATRLRRREEAGDRISIHAPAKGATSVCSLCGHPLEFQSTHPRRVRLALTLTVTRSGRLFQSTHPRRVRLGATVTWHGQDYISIHAPAKGATRGTKTVSPLRRISIHAPAKGATNQRGLQSRCSGISIHAPAKGATRRRRPLPPRTSNFNPRTREGCDCKPTRIILTSVRERLDNSDLVDIQSAGR